MAKMVLGVFSEHNNADTTVTELKDAGFDAKDISVVMKSPQEGETINGDNNITIKNGVVTKGTKGAE